MVKVKEKLSLLTLREKKSDNNCLSDNYKKGNEEKSKEIILEIKQKMFN